jgi:hypothetical protein
MMIALLLPLLALRALLPAGYMPSADDEGPRMVLCSAGLAAWSAPAGNPQPAHGTARDDCPFAHAALNAPPPHLVAAVVAVPDGRFAARVPGIALPAAGPPRQALARAPPVLL